MAHSGRCTTGLVVNGFWEDILVLVVVGICLPNEWAIPNGQFTKHCEQQNSTCYDCTLYSTVADVCVNTIILFIPSTCPEEHKYASRAETVQVAESAKESFVIDAADEVMPLICGWRQPLIQVYHSNSM